MESNDIIELIRRDKAHLSKVYTDCKDYCLNFMIRMHSDKEVLLDIYQDAIIVFYEKTKDPEFKLTCTVQTYLNSICRYQLLNRFNSKSALNNADEFDPNYNDWFEDDDLENEKESKIQSIEKGLAVLKGKGGKCYEILKRFFYEKQSMNKIAEEMDYTNAANAKHQKSRCQKQLKELVHNQNSLKTNG